MLQKRSANSIAPKPRKIKGFFEQLMLMRFFMKFEYELEPDGMLR